MKKLAIAIAVYVAIMAAFAVVRWNLWTFGTDTGTFTQVVHTAFAGFRDGPEHGTHFRFHWAPLIGSLFPLVFLLQNGLALQLAQIVLVACTAVPLFAIARTYTNENRAFAFASLTLLYPPLAAVAFTEFHEIAFYPVLALAVFWAAERARWDRFALFALLASGIREEACMVLALAGGAFVVIGLACRDLPASAAIGLLAGRPREPLRLALAGAGLIALNVGALAVYFGIVIPHVGAWQPSRFYDYSWAHGPAQMVAVLSSHPVRIAGLVTIGRFTYLLEALTPLAFLPLFSRWSILAVPGFAIVLLSSDPIAWRMGSHYAAIWVPWLLLAAIATLVRFERTRSRVFAARWYTGAIASCAVFLIAIDPLHPAHYLRAIYPHGDAARALAYVPAGAALLTHDEWFTHVAYGHPNATVFFCPYVDYVVVADDYPNGYFRDAIAPEIARELASKRMQLLRRFGHVRLYARTPSIGTPGSCVTPGDVRYTDLPTTLGTGH